MKAPRDAYGKVLLELGSENERVFVLTADLASSTKTGLFAKQFPDRFLNVGIAEQDMVGIAAGLSRAGFVPVFSTFACFAPGRTYDQIRQSIAYSNANVKIISTHPGLSIGMDGAIHQSLDDIALTRELPNMVVLAPSDEIETREAVKSAIEHEGPVYVRVGRKECPKLLDSKYKFQIGKGYILREGKDITLIGHGSMVSAINEAAGILEREGISSRVISMASIKPIDRELIIESAKKTKGIVTAEDHFLYGGLYSAVCEVVSSEYPCIVKGIAVNDTFGESGKPEELYTKYGLTKEHIIKKVFEILD
ncbi:MAG: transketolase family protein [Firmicutes bacterium]|nr:transketolase family protein [Bacillota bacterium]